jgi:hypothetical protein
MNDEKINEIDFKTSVLVACEESQAVTIEFRKLGIKAYSCDIDECSGGHPEWHLQMDATLILNYPWLMIIAFPPCTYMTNASAVRMTVKGILQQGRYEKMLQAKEFFLKILNAPCDKIVIENPVPLGICELPRYSQIIQPFEHGHPYSKRTCLWLKGVSKLKQTNIMPFYTPYVNGGCKDANGNYRRATGRKERDPKTRSKTFPGIAKAMAEQWGSELLKSGESNE